MEAGISIRTDILYPIIKAMASLNNSKLFISAKEGKFVIMTFDKRRSKGIRFKHPCDTTMNFDWIQVAPFEFIPYECHDIDIQYVFTHAKEFIRYQDSESASIKYSFARGNALREIDLLDGFFESFVARPDIYDAEISTISFHRLQEITTTLGETFWFEVDSSGVFLIRVYEDFIDSTLQCWTNPEIDKIPHPPWRTEEFESEELGKFKIPKTLLYIFDSKKMIVGSKSPLVFRFVYRDAIELELIMSPKLK